MSENKKDFIFASASKYKTELLEKIKFFPKQIVPADVDETPFTNESPFNYVKRVACSKCEYVHSLLKNENVLASDTICVCNNQILQKPRDINEFKHFLKMFSGRKVKALTGICFISKDGKRSVKVEETKIQFKHFNRRDIDDAIQYSDSMNCAGGLKVEGFSECLAKSINGSYSNIIGMPLCTVRNILISNNI